MNKMFSSHRVKRVASASRAGRTAEAPHARAKSRAGLHLISSLQVVLTSFMSDTMGFPNAFEPIVIRIYKKIAKQRRFHPACRAPWTVPHPTMPFAFHGHSRTEKIASRKTINPGQSALKNVITIELQMKGLIGEIPHIVRDDTDLEQRSGRYCTNRLSS